MATPKQEPLPPFEDCISGEGVWDNFEKYSALRNEIRLGVDLLESSRLKEAKRYFLSLMPRTENEISFHYYNFLALIHFFSLEYQEAEYYILKGITSPKNSVRRHFLNCLLFLERSAEIPGAYSPITLSDALPALRKINTVQSLVWKFFENKFLLSQLLPNTPYRHVRLFRHYCDEEKFLSGAESLVLRLKGISVFSFYEYEGDLWLYDLQQTRRIDTKWAEALTELGEIMEENKRVLKSGVDTEKEKRAWWSARIALDRRLGKLVAKMSSALNIKIEERVILITDDATSGFPFDEVFQAAVYRVSSLEVLFALAGVGPYKSQGSCPAEIFKAFYLLDAENNLLNTKQRISRFLREMKTPELCGVDGRSLTPAEISTLCKYDLFMYFGHGTGRKHYSLKECSPRMAFLFGCSSCRLLRVKNFRSNGVLLEHLRRGRTVLGALWDVTDKDLDSFTVGFLFEFFSGKDVGAALLFNKKLFRLRHINGSAIVLYGIPEDIKKILQATN